MGWFDRLKNDASQAVGDVENAVGGAAQDVENWTGSAIHSVGQALGVHPSSPSPSAPAPVTTTQPGGGFASSPQARLNAPNAPLSAPPAPAMPKPQQGPSPTAPLAQPNAPNPQQGFSSHASFTTPITHQTASIINLKQPGTPTPPSASGNDPVGNFLTTHFAKPVEGLFNQVANAPVGEAVKYGAAELTGNQPAAANAQAGLQQSLHNLQAPPRTVMDPKTGLQVLNPAYNAYITNMAMGAEGGLEATGEEAAAKGAADAAKPTEAPVPTSAQITDALANPKHTNAAAELLGPENTLEGYGDQSAFPARNADAERVALEELHNTGDYDAAVRRYQDMAGADPATAMSAVNNVMRESGMGVNHLADTGVEPLTIPDATPANTAKAAQDLVDTYNSRANDASSMEDLRRANRGKQDEFKLRSAALERAMAKDLTRAERKAVRDNLEGAADPAEVTPKIDAVTRVMRQLNEYGAQVLDMTHATQFARLKNYATRLYHGGLEKASGMSGTKIVKSALQQLFDTTVGFGRHREITKFVSEDGDVKYGTQSSLGIKKNAEGQLVKDGKVYTPQEVSTNELEANGIKYEKDYGKIANAYHSHVGKARANYDALQAVKADPEKFGLSRDEEPGMKEVDVKGLEGLYAKPSTLKQLRDLFAPIDQHGLIQQGLARVNQSVQSLIMFVANIHILNQSFQFLLSSGKITFRDSRIQSGPIGTARAIGTLGHYIVSRDFREAATTDYLRDNGVLVDHSQYGQSLTKKVLDKAHVGGITKASSGSIMQAVDNAFRVSTHATEKALGGDGRAIARDVADFMGDEKRVPETLKYFTIFYNYLRTTTRSLGKVALRPDKNYGATVNFVIGAAMFLGLQAAWQNWTGNKHAKLHAPGALGTAKEIIDAPGEVKSGQAPSIVTNHINPLLTAAEDQIHGENYYTKQKFNNNGDRAKDALGVLVSPSQYVTKVQSGKSTPAEQAVRVLTGATLPHASGAPAAPNLTGEAGALLNTHDAKPAQDELTSDGLISDKTGVDQAKQYRTTRDAGATKIGPQNQSALDAYNNYLDRDHTASGQTIQVGDQAKLAQYGALAGNPAAMEAMRELQLKNGNQDPLWKLDGEDLRTALSNLAKIDTDPEKQVDLDTKKLSDGTSLKDFITARDNYFKWLPSPDGPLPATNPLTVAKLNFSPAQQATLDGYNALGDNATAQKAYVTAHPEITGLWQQEAQHKNALGVSQGGDALNLAPQMDPGLQKAFDAYNALPKGDGKYGGSPERAAWIKANQDTWNKIQAALADSTMYDVAKGGALAQYQGEQPSQKYLKAISTAGKYDIVKGADGSYSINPAAAYAANGSGSGKGFSSGFKKSTKKPFVPGPKKVKRHYVQLKHPPKNKKVKPHIVNVAPVRTKTSSPAHPTKVAHKTSVIKLK